PARTPSRRAATVGQSVTGRTRRAARARTCIARQARAARVLWAAPRTGARAARPAGTTRRRLRASFLHLLDCLQERLAIFVAQLRLLDEVEQHRARGAVEDAIDELAHHAAEHLGARLRG